MKKKQRRKMREMDGGMSKRIAELLIEELAKMREQRKMQNERRGTSIQTGGEGADR